MLLELSKLRGPVERVARRYDASALNAPGEPYRLVSSVLLEFDARKDDDRYRLTGTIQATLELDCSRCAEAFQILVDTPFDLRYFPAAENVGEGEIEVQEDDLDASFYHGEKIDLAQLVREQIYLALPMKPLCAENCRGVCPECGTNRNLGTCSCAPKWDDPRWAGLRSLSGSAFSSEDKTREE